MEHRNVSSRTDHSRNKANPLTEREYQVLLKAAEGHTSMAIAELLCIKERTVNFHLSGVFRKLGSRNRKEAIAMAKQKSLLG